MKTADLTGAQLDYWVAKALDLPIDYIVKGHPAARVPSFIACLTEDPDFGDIFEPSTRWDHGGPIIEREHISLVYEGGFWSAGRQRSAPYMFTTFEEPRGSGPTPLIAAMRAFVASKFGEEVPDA